MNRRRLLLVATLLLLGVGAWVAWRQPSAITPRNAARVEVKMTLAEVEEILGGPARDEASGPIRFSADGGAGILRKDDKMASEVPRENGVLRVWVSDHALVYVNFSEDGRVVNASWVPPYTPPSRLAAYTEEALGTLQRWLHR